MLKRYSYKLRSGNASASDVIKAYRELEDMLNVYRPLTWFIADKSQLSSLMLNIDEADNFLKSRFSNLVSYLYATIYLPRKEFEDHMKYCYHNAKKITKESGIYLILQ